MKKILSILILCALVAGLVGCGGSSTTVTSSANSSEANDKVGNVIDSYFNAVENNNSDAMFDCYLKEHIDQFVDILGSEKDAKAQILNTDPYYGYIKDGKGTCDYGGYDICMSTDQFIEQFASDTSGLEEFGINDLEEFEKLIDTYKESLQAETYIVYAYAIVEEGNDSAEDGLFIVGVTKDDVGIITGGVMKQSTSVTNSTTAIDATTVETTTIKATVSGDNLWPGTEYTYEFTDYNGYVTEWTIKFGSWIKTSDKDSLNKAWNAAGGEGDAPDLKTFNKNASANASVMTFATLEVTNKTEGYDFTEQSPYIGSTRFNLIYPDKSSLVTLGGKIYFSNDTGDPFDYFNISMKKNHWGPVLMAIAITNVFTPNFDENGNPDIEEVQFTYFGQYISIPVSWKTNK